MDPFQFDVNNSDDLEEKFSLKRTFARSPSLSTITEETPGSSLSGGTHLSSKGSELDHHTPKSKKMKTIRRLFSAKDEGMELDNSSSDGSDTTPSKGQMRSYDSQCKQRAESDSFAESCSKTDWAPKKPLQDRNWHEKTCKHALKTEHSNAKGGEGVKLREQTNDPFDDLFVHGIFNAVTPVSPTVKELQTMYINNSSDDDGSPPPKKCRKISQMPKKEVQSKLAFKKLKNSHNPSFDFENDSDF